MPVALRRATMLVGTVTAPGFTSRTDYSASDPRAAMPLVATLSGTGRRSREPERGDGD
ncbi:hypothetical protein RND61_16905 [Streptomyces sp. TRM76323]|uniref:Uncharacterized protein n=1 Tax=Streptomyces tamarix TaxID=3078565 RepID=A0ABU3QML8_9ACTN|nr:hypothetical protein [Streptomyces tamarix]MDT9683728.1 hypothetical protein [Streptomyces tamarix]